MEDHPAVSLTILCGHTHGEGDVEIRPNIRAITGAAEYKEPRVTQVIDV